MTITDAPHAPLVRQLRAVARTVQSQQVKDLLFTAAGVLARANTAPGADGELATVAEAEARYADMQTRAAPLLDVARAVYRWRTAQEQLNGIFEAELELLRAAGRLDAAGGLPPEV